MKYSLITHWRWRSETPGPGLGSYWMHLEMLRLLGSRAPGPDEMYFVGRKRADVRDLDADFEWYM